MVKRYLRLNPHATNAQVAKALQVSERLVTLARSELAIEGEPVRAAADFTSPVAKIEEGELRSLEAQAITTIAPEIAALEVATGHPITVEEQVGILTRHIRSPNTSPQILGGLVTVLQRIQPPSKERVGPGPPLTPEARTKRLSLLIQACGLQVTQAALQSAGFSGEIALAERQNERQDPEDQEGPQVGVPEPGADPSEYSPRTSQTPDPSGVEAETG